MGILFGKANFSFVRGTEWADDFILTDSATGDPVDLTGITSLIMRVREDYATPILLECSTSDGELVVLDPVAGRVGIRVAGAASRAAFPENGHAKAVYRYDAIIERTPGTYEPANGGKITVLPQITRPWDDE